MTLSSSIQTFAQDAWGHIDPQSQVWKAWNSTNATFDTESRMELRFEKIGGTGQSKFVLQNSDKYNPQRHTSHTVNELKEIAGRIDAVYMTTTYRNVINNAAWRTMFQVAQRPVSKIVGLAPTAQNEETMPCYKCGLVLPLRNITIDHQKPQTGGAAQAVLKVLRNINVNLTHAGGVGRVAAAFAAQNFQPLPTRAGQVDGVNTPGADSRYTLNNKGILFLSVAMAASSENEVVGYCVHSLFNLKPFCGHCNSKKGSALPDLSGINE